MSFQIAGEPPADKVLDEYPFAVVMGMMLDQQYGMEHAFRGGYKVLSRSARSTQQRSRRQTPKSSRRCAAHRQQSTATPDLWPPGCKNSQPSWCRSTTVT